MKKLTLALTAHVDAGKTTLAEALLHRTGVLRVPGRVDKGSAALDSHETERRRGITIFSGEASFLWKETEINLLDTPGHVDFSPETERAMSAADAALLIISGLDGVQAHTRSLWQLLENKRLPVLIFISKMDVGRQSREDLLRELKELWGDACLPWESLMAGGEETALLEEALLEKHLNGDTISKEECLGLIRGRKAFPVFFGSGLKEEGIDTLWEAMELLAKDWERAEKEPFSARVHKISFDEKGMRQTHVKLLTGQIRPRDTVLTEGGEEEKVSFIRRSLGGRAYQTETLSAGSLGVLVGLEKTGAGQLLGGEEPEEARFFEPCMRYSLILPEPIDADSAYLKLKPLTQEDPSLNLGYGPGGVLEAELMGPVQGEVLLERIRAMTGWEVRLDEGRVLYKETVTAPKEGVGHYEPLRHYAEVHVAIRPLPRGSGVTVRNETDARSLDPLVAESILRLLAAGKHKGVLIKAPLTDVEISLLGARDHEKHTEGGDLREAACRALRQGLMREADSGQMKLLEPYRGFILKVPADKLGRALSDIRARFGEAAQEEGEDGEGLIPVRGRAPLQALLGYDRELAAYTGGRGRIMLWSEGYDVCHNPEEVIREAAYDPRADREDPCDSIFCAHGAGFSVPWDQVPEHMHLPWLLKEKAGGEQETGGPGAGGSWKEQKDARAAEAELEAIMLREFGPIKRPAVNGASHRPAEALSRREPVQLRSPRTYVIDGYNLIFSWDELKELSTHDIEMARQQLIRRLQNFAAYTDKQLVLVFDGYRVGGGEGAREEMPHLSLAYTREHETADMYIEQMLAERKKEDSMAVVSNDNLIRLSAIRQGALRIRCEEFLGEYRDAMESLKARTDGESRIGSRISW